MSSNAVCRACLSPNVLVYPAPREYFNQFENLTNIKVMASDGKPLGLCYICYHHIRKYCKFRKRCLEVDQTLNQFILTHTKQSSDIAYNKINVNFTPPFKITTTQIVDFPPQIPLQEEMNIVIKEEWIEPTDDEEDNTASEDFSIASGNLQDFQSNCSEMPVTIKKEDLKVINNPTLIHHNYARSLNTCSDSVEQNATEGSVLQLKPLKVVLNRLNLRQEDESQEEEVQLAVASITEPQLSAQFLNNLISESDIKTEICDSFDSPMISHNLSLQTTVKIEPIFDVDESMEVENAGSDEEQTNLIKLVLNKPDQPYVLQADLTNDLSSAVANNSNRIKLEQSEDETDSENDFYIKEDDSDSDSDVSVGFDEPRHDQGAADESREVKSEVESTDVERADSVIAKVLASNAFLGKCKKIKRVEALKISKHCDLCGKEFFRFDEIKIHLIQHLLTNILIKNPISASGKLSLQCVVCNQTPFDRIDQYKQHLRQHANLRTYHCEVCDKYFSNSSNFTKHKKVHGGKYSECELCRKRFFTKKCFEVHMQRHSEHKPVKCETCGKEFFFLSMLKKHLKSAHANVDLKRYKCRLCFEYHDSLKNKWEHEWKVHGARKRVYDCHLCEEKFRKYSDLKSHCNTVHVVSLPLATEYHMSNMRKHQYVKKVRSKKP